MNVVLDAEASSHEIHWDDGSPIVLEHDDLDVTVGDLAGNQPGLEVSDADSGTPWNSQLVLKGSSGNDSITVNDGFATKQTNPVLHFEATEGSDLHG